MRSRWRAALPALLLCSGAAIGAERGFDLAVAVQSNRGDAPRVLRVLEGDAVRLRIRSDSAGEVHLHGYRLAARVLPGTAAELAFTAHATGRFRIEWHAGSGTPAPSHHAPPLAILEVRPR
jgi:hypothetical protein